MLRVVTLISFLFISIGTNVQGTSAVERLRQLKMDLNEEFGFPADRSLCILAVTRTPIKNEPTRLISHRELEQLLRLLYASCVPASSFFSSLLGNQFRYSDKGVNLNGNLDVLLEHGLQVSDMQSINNTKKQLEHYFKCNDLANKCKIVVFNEMFFSQKSPLTSDQMKFIQGKLFDLSCSAPNTVFYPNFLYIENRDISKKEIMAGLNGMIRMKNAGYMVIENTDIVECYQLHNQIWQQSQSINYSCNFLLNETFSICRGRLLTKYRKVGYYHEDDAAIRSGALYGFGRGYDEPLGPYNKLQDILLGDISLEICLDLSIGARKNLGPYQWKNPTQNRGIQESCIHVIQASSIAPFYYNQQNTENLPTNRGIIHVDKYPHPSWITPEQGRPQNVFLPYYTGGYIVDDVVRNKEEFYVRFVDNDYRFSFLNI